jgi:uncharacterized protein YprB with RNaseH-like and TPR domain
MAKKLAGRLAHLRQVRSEKPAKKPARSAPEVLPGWQAVGEFTWRRETVHPNPLDGVAIAGLLEPAPDRIEDLRFFDLETTGLSGGAGTYPFLLGFGYAAGPEFRIVQYYMADLPGEAETLRRFVEELGPAPKWVSYNGKSFDAPFLRSKAAVAGVYPDFTFHVDLLHPVRRLWRPVIGACSLGDVEGRILGIQRQEDVESALVPDIYLDFVKTGVPGDIDLVFKHHSQDILNLAQVWAVVEGLAGGTEPRPQVPPDPTGLWSILRAREPVAAERVLEDAAVAGNLRARWVHALLLKRRGDWDRAVEWWESLLEGGNWRAGVELAKWLEHRSKESSAALAIAEGLRDFEEMPPSARRDLERRIYRLRRKVE